MHIILQTAFPLNILLASFHVNTAWVSNLPTQAPRAGHLGCFCLSAIIHHPANNLGVLVQLFP